MAFSQRFLSLPTNAPHPYFPSILFVPGIPAAGAAGCRQRRPASPAASTARTKVDDDLLFDDRQSLAPCLALALPCWCGGGGVQLRRPLAGHASHGSATLAHCSTVAPQHETGASLSRAFHYTCASNTGWVSGTIGRKGCGEIATRRAARERTAEERQRITLIEKHPTQQWKCRAGPRAHLSTRAQALRQHAGGSLCAA
jgi:hypothetical protein